MLPHSQKAELELLPRPFKQLQFGKDEILRAATPLKELPSILIPSNDRRIPLPPHMHYGYPLQVDRTEEIFDRKLGCPPGTLVANPFDLLVCLQRDVFHYGVKFQVVYCNGTDSMLFIAISSNWKPAPADRLAEVVKKLKDFLELDDEPVWCLDRYDYYWRK